MTDSVHISLSPLAAALLDKVRRYDHVTYAELERVAVEQGIDPTGEWAIIPNQDYPTILTWVGISEAFIEALQEIQPHVEQVPASLLVYLIDGKVPRLPIAKRVHRYKQPHWAPVCLRPKPLGGTS